AAQTHLEKQGVARGDLFLFFGWFREVEFSNNDVWRYKPDAPDIHVIFGWLLVAQVLNVDGNAALHLKQYPWLTRHPHLQRSTGHWRKNTVYIALIVWTLSVGRTNSYQEAEHFNLLKRHSY